MKLQNAVLLLIIGSILALLADATGYISFWITRPGAKFDVADLLYRLSHISMVVGFLLWGLAFRRSGSTTGTRKASLVIAIGAAALLLSLLYFYAEAYSSFYRMNSYQYMVYNLFDLLLPVSMLLFGLSLTVRSQKLKRAAWWLTFGGTIYFLLVFFNRMVTIAVGGLTHNPGPRTIAHWFEVLSVLFPLGLALTAMLLPDRAATDTDNAPAFIEIDSDLIDTSSLLEPKTIVTTTDPENKVRWWLSTFLLASIPLIGIGFMLYWSVSKKHVKRGNWAAASMIMAAFSTILLTLYYSSLVAQFLSSFSLGIIVLVVIGVMVTLAIIAGAFNSRNQENLAPGIDDDAPNVSGWIGYSLLVAIPLVGFICLIVWAANSEQRYRQQWASARLIWSGISVIYYFFLTNAIDSYSVYVRNPDFLNF